MVKNDELDQVEFHENNENNSIDNDDDFCDLQELDPLVTDSIFTANMEDHITAYLASVLQKCIIEGRWYSPIRCQDCLHAFSEDEIVHDEFVKLKMKTSKLRSPAQSTIQICKITEMVMREYNYETGNFDQIEADILSQLNIHNLFWASDFDAHEEPNHKIRLIKLIIEMYIRKKQEYISKCNTLAAHETLWRSLLKKIVHFRGQ